MSRRLMSFCSICVLISCGEWLKAFSEKTLDDSDESNFSYLAINKSPMPMNASRNRNRNKSLYSPNFKLSEDYIRLVSRNCYDFFNSRNNFSPSKVRLHCRQVFNNQVYGDYGMVKETEASRKRTSVSFKRNKQWLHEGKDKAIKDTQSLMATTKFLISKSNTTNTDIVSPKDKNSFLPEVSVAEAATLLPGLQDLGRKLSSFVPTSKRRSPCRMDTPLTIDENQPLPWECFQRRRWRTLHGNVYPDRLYETVCEGSCMNGHYNCTPVKYTTHVVQFCSTGHCSDERTPPVYRNVWRFLNLEVTVGCACTR